MNLNFSTVKYFVFFRVGVGLICDYRFQTMVLIGTANAFAGRLKPLDDMHRRCQNKSLRVFVVKKSCLRNLRNQRLIKPVIIWEICGSKTTYLKKQTQFFPFLSPKTAFYQNQSQFKPNSKPKQTQFKAKTNPIQSQSNPIYPMTRLTVDKGEIYD